MQRFAEAALEVLRTAPPSAKVAAAERLAAIVNTRPPDQDGPPSSWPAPPVSASRPALPRLVSPAEVPRRRPRGRSGRIALLHAVAHIEFNAVNLAADMALRFAAEIDREGLDWRAFAADWATIAGDEARHFEMISNRLTALGSHYGALPAHGGLWEAAEATADCVLARLAIAPMVLEARGLDVTPGMIRNFQAAADIESSSILSMIYADEIGHVATGVKWFRGLCAARGKPSQATFRQLVRDRFSGELKPPFNAAGRSAAGLPSSYYAEVQ